MEKRLRNRWTWIFVGAGTTALLVVTVATVDRSWRRSECKPTATPDRPPEAVAADGMARSVVPARPEPVDPAATTEPCAIRFRDVTAQSGMTFVHTDGSSGRRYIVEQMTAGLATFDYDGDGLIDIYFPNGAPLPGAAVAEPPRHALYKNLGDWRFQDVTAAAGVACTAYGLGIAVGDYDGDGRPDVYLNNFGPNVLYRNNGDGTFADVTKEARVARGELVGGGACFLDAEGRGQLDLYVGNYIAMDLSKHVRVTVGGLPAYPSPVNYAPVPDVLFRNNGDGTFTDVTKESGIGQSEGRCMGITCADYDNDGRTDVFVCNDVQENFLFHNLGGGRFEEVGMMAGVAFNETGVTMANMGVDAGDFDNDGRLDFFTTNYQGQYPMLFHNRGDGTFEEIGRAANAGAGVSRYVNWGAGFVDLDNDGHRDLFIGCGHTDDNIEQRDSSTSYKAPNAVLKNLGNGRFANVSEQAGIRGLPWHVARGVAFDDLDNDGDIDVVILNSRERPTILRNMLNESGSKSHWLQIRLCGVKTNRDGVGARVRVVAGDLTQIDEVHSGRGYQSHWGTRLHFGLGERDRVDRIEVHWIGGGVDVIENQSIDRLVTLVEGSGTR